MPRGAPVIACVALDGVKQAALRAGWVGAGGFEPPASCSQSRRANQAAPRPVVRASHEPGVDVAAIKL